MKVVRARNSNSVKPIPMMLFALNYFCCVRIVSSGYDPIDDVYVPVTNLSDLPWFDNTQGEVSSEVENVQQLTSVSLQLLRFIWS